MTISATVTASPGNEHDIDWALVALRLFVCIAGILGNFMVAFVIIVLQEYKKAVTHWYVLQLAVADSIFLFTLPFKIVEDIQNQWTFSIGMCKAKETVLFINYYASILFLTIMSIDRYIAVCHGFSDLLQKFRTHRAANIITFVTWFIALLLCIPVMMYSNKAGTEPNCLCSYTFPKDYVSPEELCKKQGFIEGENLELCLSVHASTASLGHCKPRYDEDTGGSNSGDYEDYIDYDEYAYNSTTYTVNVEGPVIGTGCNYSNSGRMWKGFLIFNFICMFLLPLFVMSYCYAMIIFKLQETKAKKVRNTSHSITSTNAFATSSERGCSGKRLKHSRSKSAASVKANSERNRITIMCAVLVGLFVACWLPFHSIHMAKVKGMNIYVENEKWCSLLPVIASLIAYLNSALNPYLYNFIGTRFGKRFGGAVHTVRKSVKSRTSSVSSGMGVSFHKKKKMSFGESTSLGATVATKIYKGRESKNEVSSAVLSDTEKNCVERNEIKDEHSSNAEKGEKQNLLQT